ncbi:class I tRNA ligase family protein, partial [uncultured Dokdonia sp.]|uniref:class I tRNA ligase family protein n=1 Tax=uncultured Dokdonia sp. TaxID=575653 RepID=UPI00260F817F
FVKVDSLAKPAIEAVENGQIELVPKQYENMYFAWMRNIQDWCISRQLWWGHRIPVYYDIDGNHTAAKSEEEARAKLNLSPEAILKQDEDVLDTWFSSWLWPMSVFDGIRHPDNEEFNYYYPTNDLVTGPDILFFWVARMIIAGYEYTGKRPFENVYLTGLVRDKQGRKMSKSLGNSPDALKLIDDYGADGVRVGLLLSSAAGNDLMFDEELCDQGKKFINKNWNAFRLIQGWEISDDIPQPEASKIGIEWYTSKFNKTLLEIEDHFSKYRISNALMATYKLVWDDFCGWLLEIIKPAYQQPIDRKTYNAVINALENNLRILHPFIPFASEEIWQTITDRTPEEALIINHWPKQESVNEQLISDFEYTSQVISGIRTIRKSKNIAFKDAIELHVVNHEAISSDFDTVIAKLGNVDKIAFAKAPLDGALSFRVKSNEYFIPLAGAIDVEAETAKIEEELKYTKGFLQSVAKKLSNERFVNNAPEKVVAIEKQKMADAEATIETLEKRLKSLS